MLEGRWAFFSGSLDFLVCTMASLFRRLPGFPHRLATASKPLGTM